MKTPEYQPSTEQQNRLDLLKKIIGALETQQIRYSVVGGYGLDGLYGKLTRDHGDIDMVVVSEDMEKTRILLNDNRFEREEDKTTGIEVYFHRATATKLELADLKLVKSFTQEADQIIMPGETNASLDGISFRTATIDGYKIMRKIQDERFKTKHIHSTHDEEIIKSLSL